MPLILEPADWLAWLGEAQADPVSLLRRATNDVLRRWPVSRAVNSVRNKGGELPDPIDDPHAPPPSDAPVGRTRRDRSRRRVRRERRGAGRAAAEGIRWLDAQD